MLLQCLHADIYIVVSYNNLQEMFSLSQEIKLNLHQVSFGHLGVMETA